MKAINGCEERPDRVEKVLLKINRTEKKASNSYLYTAVITPVVPFVHTIASFRYGFSF